MIQTRGRPKWTIMSHPAKAARCVCGEIHDGISSSSSSKRMMITEEIKTMMVTFGDYDPPCEAAALYVQNLGKV
jgi:hypothetical protein